MDKAEEGRRCLFVPGRPCNMELDEVPLEICRLCLDAWKFYVSNVMVRLQPMRLEEGKPSLQPQVQGAPIQEGMRTLKDLLQIDDLFMRGELTFKDYVARRKEALKHLQESFP